MGVFTLPDRRKAATKKADSGKRLRAINCRHLSSDFEQRATIPVLVNSLDVHDPIPSSDSRITTPFALQSHRVRN